MNQSSANFPCQDRPVAEFFEGPNFEVERAGEFMTMAFDNILLIWSMMYIWYLCQ